jgi:hypothetical protein
MPDDIEEIVARAIHAQRTRTQFNCEPGGYINPRLGQRTLTWDELGDSQQKEIEIARAAIEAYEAATPKTGKKMAQREAAPDQRRSHADEGMVMVPREAVQDQKSAGAELLVAMSGLDDEDFTDDAAEIYQAMISAYENEI